MRHGKGDSFWWKQERGDHITSQCNLEGNIFESIQLPSEDHFLLQYISLYVMINERNDDYWRLKFFECLGGISHVQCQCCNFPLIPTNSTTRQKSKCNFKFFKQSNGVLQTNGTICDKFESFVCSNTSCRLRICKRCFNSFPKTCVTTIIPSPEIQNNSNDNDQCFSIDENVEDSNSSDYDDNEQSSSTSNEEIFNNHDIEESINNFAVYSEQDVTLDITVDNSQRSDGFCTTNSGDIPVNINQDLTRDTVSAHVIFNQAGKCTNRRYRNIEGTSRQKHMVQSLCSTIPGQASPLLQPEAALFPRHFYISAKNDKCSILGARPLFLINSKTHPYGFASTLSQARMHMTNPCSTTSTDPSFMCNYFDQLGNVALGQCHSRDIFERGFVVDNRSAIGMKVREKDHTKLDGSVDSRKMVRNLSASQQYIKYTWFLTFTANQSEHPGLEHLHLWKNSMKWLKNLKNWDHLSYEEISEYKKSMEEAYGVHIYISWKTVKHILLLHLKHHITVLGTSVAIFSRDEYQKDDGNLNHNHLILAIDKEKITTESENCIQNLIRTSVLEVIKSDDDINRLIDSGVLKSVDEINEVTERADKILRHHCNDRCRKRIGTRNSDKDFRCQKMHSVRDNPDPTKHSYVPINYRYQETFLDIMNEIGMYSPPQYENEKLGNFTHPYFHPKRHMPPCNFNAKCNMSPVIVDFFAASKSMQNAQALDHTNGIAKYVCKYISKFDEGNYVVLCQDIHSGEWVFGKKHLHNTKVVWSKINEDKAFAMEKMNKHPKGREIPHFEIRQILLGHPEVFTNLEFIQISTLPFEQRPTNKVELDAKGDVVDTNNEENNEDEHPNDSYSTIPLMQQVRTRKNLCSNQRMTTNQLATYRNHNGNAAQYDMISIFSLRPPELLHVFQNPIIYFRLCYIVEENISVETIESGLSDDINSCRWIDCLGRHVKLRLSGLNEIAAIVEKNLSSYDDEETLIEEEIFSRNMNYFILDIIAAYNSSIQGDTSENF